MQSLALEVWSRPALEVWWRYEVTRAKSPTTIRTSDNTKSLSIFLVARRGELWGTSNSSNSTGLLQVIDLSSRSSRRCRYWPPPRGRCWSECYEFPTLLLRTLIIRRYEGLLASSMIRLTAVRCCNIQMFRKSVVEPVQYCNRRPAGWLWPWSSRCIRQEAIHSQLGNDWSIYGPSENCLAIIFSCSESVLPTWTDLLTYAPHDRQNTSKS